MNFTYRINQFKNLLQKRGTLKTNLNWIYLYGLPRSGTTYALNELLAIAKMGIGDWDLYKLIPVFVHYEKEEHIFLDTNKLKDGLKANIITSAPPGGGNQYDLIVKQTLPDLSELPFLTEVFGSAPAKRIFFYRDPAGWLPSAKKKYDWQEREAISKYETGLNLYNTLGGEAWEYCDLGTLLEKQFNLSPKTPFKNNDHVKPNAPLQLVDLYQQFKQAHLPEN